MLLQLELRGKSCSSSTLLSSSQHLQQVKTFNNFVKLHPNNVRKLHREAIQEAEAAAAAVTSLQSLDSAENWQITNYHHHESVQERVELDIVFLPLQISFTTRSTTMQRHVMYVSYNGGLIEKGTSDRSSHDGRV